MRLRLAALALLAAISVAHAESSAGKKDLVAKILVLQQPGIDGLARNLAEQSVRPLIQAAGQALQTQVPADKREAAAKSLDAEVRKYLDETTPLLRDRATKLAPATIGPALEEKFSEDELKQVVTWLESSANKKYQQLGPEMQNAMVQKLIGDNRATIEPKLKALEDRLANVLGLPPRPAAGASGAAPAASGPAPAASGSSVMAKPAAGPASKPKP